MRIRGPRLSIDNHPVIAGEARGLGQVVVGDGADADKNRVAVQRRPSCQPHPRHLPVQAFEPFDRHAKMEADPVLLVDIAEEGRQHRPRDPGQQPVLALQHIDLRAQLARRRRHLQADIAAADDRQPESRPEPGLDGLRVLDGAKLQEALQVAAGQHQFPCAGAGRQDQGVIGEGLVGR